MKKSLFKKGYKAVKEEEERREKAREQYEGKLWRVFFPKNADEDYEIPILFLTDEPLCFREHNIRGIGGKIENHICIGEGCPYCENQDKPRFVGAYLVVDRSEYEVKDSKTNKTKVVKDRLKLLVRGTTDLAKLERIRKKYGLIGIEWSIAKTGKDTSTTWNFDRGEKVKLSKKQLENIIPEKLRGMDYDEILEQQLMPVDDDNYEDDDYEDDDYEDDVNDKIVAIDEDEEDSYNEEEEDDYEDEEDEEEEVRPKRTHKSKLHSRVEKRKKRLRK